MVDPLPLQFGIPGGMELAVILLIAVLLFGANKIPKLARSTGEAMGEFQKGREEVEQELQDMREGPDTSDSGADSGGAAAPKPAAESESGEADLGISEAETETDETTES
jgi:sec-independent protein translocase protein TatA